MIASLIAFLALAAAVGASFGPRPGDTALRKLTVATAVVLGLGAGLVAALAFAPLPSGVWYTLLVVALTFAFLAAVAVPFVAVHWLRDRISRR